jgi:hypothetical protein
MATPMRKNLAGAWNAILGQPVLGSPGVADMLVFEITSLR